MNAAANPEESPDTAKASTNKNHFLKNHFLFMLVFISFIILFTIKYFNPYSSPASTIQTLIDGIASSQMDILLNEHFDFSNDLTDRYGEEVYQAWLSVDREGKNIHDRARTFVKNKGKDHFNKLNHYDKEDIEQQSYREFVTSIAYPAVKVRNPEFPDSLVFADLNKKNEFVHEQGIRTLSRDEQLKIGKTSRRAFIDSQEAFIRYETLQSNERQAKKRFNQTIKLYDEIHKTGMMNYNKYFKLLENEASGQLNAMSIQQRNDILNRSYNQFVFNHGYETAIYEIKKGAPDRYYLQNYTSEIFFTDDKALQYRYEMGLNHVAAGKTDLLKSFDYQIGSKINDNRQRFVHEAGRIRLFDFISDQVSRESFSIAQINYRSYETSLFYSHIAEVESNIGTFVVHQRNGEWYLADYR